MHRPPPDNASPPAPVGSPRISILAALRTAGWVTRRHLLFWGVVFSVLSALLLARNITTHTQTGITLDGDPIADDFINYYSGARLAATGRAPIVYDHDRFHDFQVAVTGVPTGISRDPWVDVRIYSYPPTAMLLSLPFGLLSFVPALIAWTLAGALLCWALLRPLVGWLAAALCVIGAPAAFFNVQSGQNGFFTAALLAGGLMALPRRPVLAGICFGCLVYKPQLGVLLPFALAAGGRWRTIAAAAMTGGALVLASFFLFGADAWQGFFARMAFERHLLEFDETLWDRMLSVFAALRQLGAPLTAAYLAQAVSALAAAAAVVAAWRAPAALELKCAVLVVATFLATPYSLDYDAVVLVFAAAWLGREGLRTGFLAWERLSILALLLVTLPMVLLNRMADLGIGPIVLWPVLLVLLRRALAWRGARPDQSAAFVRP